MAGGRGRRTAACVAGACVLAAVLTDLANAQLSTTQILTTMDSLLASVTSAMTSSNRTVNLAIANQTFIAIDGILAPASLMDAQNKTIFMKSCFNTLEKLLQLLAKGLEPDQMVNLLGTNVRMYGERVNVSQFIGWTSPPGGQGYGVHLPDLSLPSISGTTVIIASYVIIPARTLIMMTSLDGSSLASYITHLRLLQDDGTALTNSASNGDPMKFIFDHVGDENTEKITKCVALKSDFRSWDADVCQLGENKPSQTACHCSHPGTVAVSVHDKEALGMIAWSGCAFAVLCELITVMILVGLKLMETIRMYVHVSLVIALGAWQAIFLTGTRYTDVPAVCLMVAVSLHFLFIAAFCCLLCLSLYAATVAQNERPRDSFSFVHYVSISWAIPAMVVGIAFILRYENYRSVRYCWLTEADYMDFAFFIPGGFFILLNLVNLAYVFRCYLRFRRTPNKDLIQEVRIEIGACAVLLPLVSVANFLSIFVMNDSFLYYQALFSLFNFMQGIAVVWFFVINNRQVQKAWKKKFGSKIGTNPSNDKERGRVISEDRDLEPSPEKVMVDPPDRTTGSEVNSAAIDVGKLALMATNRMKPKNNIEKQPIKDDDAMTKGEGTQGHSSEETSEQVPIKAEQQEKAKDDTHSSKETSIVMINRYTDAEQAQLLENDHNNTTDEPQTNTDRRITVDTGV